jgi:hypothetical protein
MKSQKHFFVVVFLTLLTCSFAFAGENEMLYRGQCANCRTSSCPN